MKEYVLIVLLAAGLCFESSQTWYSVVQDQEHFKLVEGKQVQGSLAWGYYADEIHKDGWGKLTLHTKSFKNNLEVFAAGFLEGALQTQQIHDHKTNDFQNLFNDSIPQKEIVDFLDQQYAYTLNQIELNSHKSQYWRTVELFTQFFKGLVHGYNSHSTEDMQMTTNEFLILQAVGDLIDLKKVFSPVDWFSLSDEEFRQRTLLDSHCTVLLKIKDDLSDVFLGHNMWTAAQTMLRTYKFYNFGDDLKMQQSSYPGVIYSFDDYYLLQRQDQQLFVAETTNVVYDLEIYKNVSPQSLLCWQRAMIANLLATNGQEWTEIFKENYSGTYNNQYMVVDTKRFIPGVGAQPGFLWIVEEMPGMIVNRDVTDVMVDQGNYWPSYNIPYFKEIQEHSGQVKAAQKIGIEMTYEGAARARILKRDHVKVQSFEAYKKLMRHNKFQTDDLSHGNPTWAIAARSDLFTAPHEKVYHFATDAKITTYQRIVNQDGCMMNQIIKVTDMQSGPTYDDQPVFKWSEQDTNISHVGHPDVWNFEWISAKPQI